MVCSQCGTEIADKALVCYRCGRATLEPQERPGARRSGGRFFVSLATLALLVIGALFMSRAAIGETPRLLGWVVLALAAVALASQGLTIWRRRRGSIGRARD